MQPDCSDDWTLPSAVFLIASAGQAFAQAGSSQCMQTTGTVWTDSARSAYSRWIIDVPRWVSHSAHAWKQAWHPMQRDGSMKNSIPGSITGKSQSPNPKSQGTPKSQIQDRPPPEGGRHGGLGVGCSSGVGSW